MKKYLFILFFLTSLLANAQVSKAYRGTVSDGYNFWFYRPDEDESDGVHRPLLVFLHGASLCGNNLDRVKRYGPMDALRYGNIIDCYIIAPQNPGGSWQPRKIMNLIKWAESNYNVDSTRVYVYGMSLGGYGTIDMCATYPDKIACGMALCGGASVSDVSGIARMPMWIVHGTADRAVPVSASDKVVSAVQTAAKASGEPDRLIYTRMPGVNHGRPARIFYMKQTYDWLFSHSLLDEGRPVNRDFQITNQNMNSAYQDIKKNSKGIEAYE